MRTAQRRGSEPRPLLGALAGLLAAACGPEPAGPGGAAPSEAPAPLRFDARLELATSGKPEGVLVHDLDLDGRAELLVATRSPGSLHVFGRPGEEPRVVPLPDYPLGPALVAGPAGPRVVLVSRATGELLTLDPASAAPPQRRELPGTPRAFGVGAAAAGGIAPIAVATREDELVLIEGERVHATPLTDGLATFVTFALGGVVVGSQAETSVRVYRRRGEDALEPGPALALPGIPRACVARGDELWIAGGDHALWIVGPVEEGDGPLALREERRLDAIPIDLELAPGRAELVALSFYDLSYAVGSGETWRARGYAGQDPWDAGCGDLDGDGCLDLAIANRGAHRVSVLYGAAGGGFHAGTSVPVGRGPHALATGDLDGDGALEILVVNALAGDLALLRREPEGWTVTERHDARPAGGSVAVGDLDGDGHLDAAVSVRSAHGSRLRLLFGAEAGRLAARESAGDLALGVGAADLVLADLDGDGRAEALLADPEGGSVHRAALDEDGVPALVQSLPVPSAPRALALVDGTVLAVAAGEPGPRVGVALLATADGTLAERAFLASEDLPLDLAAGDVDGDGHDELVVLSKPGRGDGPGVVRVLRRAADGAWSATSEAATGLRPYAVALGDLDGDGRADVAVGAQNSHHVNVWRGLPGALLERLPDLGSGRGPLDVRIADLDGDGRGEIVVANNFSNDVGVLALRAGAGER